MARRRKIESAVKGSLKAGKAWLMVESVMTVSVWRLSSIDKSGLGYVVGDCRRLWR